MVSEGHRISTAAAGEGRRSKRARGGAAPEVNKVISSAEAAGSGHGRPNPVTTVEGKSILPRKSGPAKVVSGPRDRSGPFRNAYEAKARTEAKLTLKQPRERLAELDKSYEELAATVDKLRQQLGDKDETTAIVLSRLKQLEVQMHDVRLQTIDNRSVPLSTFDQISDAMIRINVITLLGAVVGGPVLALATKAILGEKIVEGAASAFIAAVSTEVANRVADPTSHRHHG